MFALLKNQGSLSKDKKREARFLFQATMITTIYILESIAFNILLLRGNWENVVTILLILLVAGLRNLNFKLLIYFNLFN